MYPWERARPNGKRARAQRPGDDQELWKGPNHLKPGEPMTAPFDLNETDRLLSTTRAVRRRLDLERSVERDVILDCIKHAELALDGRDGSSEEKGSR